MSEKANIGHRGKQSIVYGFYKHTIYSSPVQKNKSSYSPRTVPKTNSVGYSRNKRIFPLTSQNDSLTALFLQFLTGKDCLPPRKHMCLHYLLFYISFWSIICHLSNYNSGQTTKNCSHEKFQNSCSVSASKIFLILYFATEVCKYTAYQPKIYCVFLWNIWLQSLPELGL